MKIKDAINMANLMEQGNVLPKELAILFLSELDGMIQSDIMLHAPEEIVSYTDEEQEMLLRPPHDKLYVHYLVMMIRNQQQEYEGYQNTQAAVDEKLKTFRRWYVQHYRPADTDSRSYMGGTSADAFGFAYLTAYGLAVRNGYQGTEEQWLESLHGAPGDPGEPARMRYDESREMIQWGVGETWYDLFSLQALRDPAVDAFLREAGGLAEAARNSEAAARGHAKTAENAAAGALASAGRAEEQANRAGSMALGANEGANRAAGSAQNAAAAQAAAEAAADDAQTQAVTAGDHAKAAEAAAKRAEEAAAGAGGGGISTETVSGMIAGHNSNRNSHDDIRQEVQRNRDQIAALNRDKLDAARLPAAINTALAQARDSGDFDGADGRGIKSIARTSGNGAAGTTDTYTITYTDGTTSTFQVRNGTNGKDGTDGDDGITPHIGSNGNWYIGDTDTGVKAQGEGGSGSAVVVEAGIRDADAVRDAGRKPVKAMISFMDDDCRKAVYHRKDTTSNEPSLWELIQELGIPYTLACPPGSIYDPDNPVDGNEEYLTVGELQEMHRGGVGISCHHWRQYNMDDTELLPTEDDYDADLTRCLEKFRAWGITDVLSVAYPQGVIADNYLHVAKRHFRMGFGVTRGINQRPYASFRMDRCETFPRGDAYKADTTLALTEAKARVNDLAETGGWLIFMTHAWYDTFSPADLRSLVAYIREQGIEIVGVNEAIRNTGNVVEVGDIIKPLADMSNPFFVVDAEGNTYTNALHDYTPSGETLTEINVGYNLGYIGGENGTRMSSTDTNRWISDDIPVQAGEVYRLTCSSIWSGAAYAVLTAAGGSVVDIVAGTNTTPSTVLTDHEITIPEGGTVLRVSGNLTVQPDGFKIYRVDNVGGDSGSSSGDCGGGLTEEDKKELVDAVIAALPKWTGGAY